MINEDERSDDMLEFNFDEVEAETEMAWLLKIDRDKTWFPKSRCRLDSQAKTVEVPEWLAMEKGLI